MLEIYYITHNSPCYGTFETPLLHACAAFASPLLVPQAPRDLMMVVDDQPTNKAVHNTIAVRTQPMASHTLWWFHDPYMTGSKLPILSGSNDKTMT